MIDNIIIGFLHQAIEGIEGNREGWKLGRKKEEGRRKKEGRRREKADGWGGEGGLQDPVMDNGILGP